MTGEKSVEKAAKKLAQWVRIPVVKLGRDGCIAIQDEQLLRAKSIHVHVVDATGAGDVFAGVLAASWPRNPGSRAERMAALQRACAAAALSTLVPGAGDCAPDAEAIDATLRDGLS